MDSMDQCLEKFDSLTFLDDYMMRRMFSSPGKEKLFGKIVSIVLGRDDITIRSVEREKHVFGDDRTFIINGYGVDNQGENYAIQMQHYTEEDICLRARGYGALLDRPYIKDPDDVNFPTRYIIFFCDRDMFAQSHGEVAVRRYSLVEEDTKLPLGDKEATYLVNCSYKGDARKEILDLIHDLNCPRVADLKIPEIQNMMKTLKTKEEAMAYTNVLCDSREEGIRQGREEGISVGILQQKKESALKMIRKGFSDQEIAEITDLSLEEVQNLHQQSDRK